MYARIYWAASQYQYGPRLFQDSLVDWERMKKGVDDVLAQYPDEWNLQNFAKFACLANDRDKTIELLDKVRTAPDIRAWETQTAIDACYRWANAGPAQITLLFSPNPLARSAANRGGQNSRWKVDVACVERSCQANCASGCLKNASTKFKSSGFHASW